MKKTFLTNPSWKSYVTLFFLFSYISCILYIQTISSYFLSDDFDLIGKLIDDGLYIITYKFLRPVIVLSLLIDYTLWKLNVIGYHLTNICIHALNALLVSLFSRELLKLNTNCVDYNKSLLISLTIGLYFLVLPCHSESVSWISGRTDVIATCFILLSLITWCHYLDTFKYASLLISLITFGLALYSKESAIATLPILMIIGCRQYFKSSISQSKVPLKSIFKIWLVFVAIALLYLLHRHYILGSFWSGYSIHTSINIMLTRMLENLARYSIRVFVAPLCPIYSYVFHKDNLSMLGLIEVGVICLSIIITGILQKHKSSQQLILNRKGKIFIYMLFGSGLLYFLIPIIRIQLFWYKTNVMRFIMISLTLSIAFIMTLTWLHCLFHISRRQEVVRILPLRLCFLLSLLPTITMSVALYDTQSERFLYFPSVFVAISTVYTIVFIVRFKAIKIVILFVLIVFSGYQLWQVNSNWMRAGELSRNILCSLANQIYHPHILILNVPDNLDGAYVFRSGLPNAIRLYMNTNDISCDIIIRHDIYSIQESFRIYQHETNPLHFSLFLGEGSNSYFIGTCNLFEISKIYEGHFEIDLKYNLEQEYDIFVYNSGTMKKIVFDSYCR